MCDNRVGLSTRLTLTLINANNNTSCTYNIWLGIDASWTMKTQNCEVPALRIGTIMNRFKMNGMLADCIVRS